MKYRFDFGAIQRNKSFYYLIIIFCLGITLRITPILYLELSSPGWHEKNINEIEFYYDDVARSLIAGKGFVHSVNPRPTGTPFSFTPGTPFSFVPPLYAWLLYIPYKLFGLGFLRKRYRHGDVLRIRP